MNLIINLEIKTDTFCCCRHLERVFVFAQQGFLCFGGKSLNGDSTTPLDKEI